MMSAERMLMALLLGGIAIGCVLVLYPFLSADPLGGYPRLSPHGPPSDWLRSRARLGRTGAPQSWCCSPPSSWCFRSPLLRPAGRTTPINLRKVVQDALQAGLPQRAALAMGRAHCRGPTIGDLWIAGQPTSTPWWRSSSRISAKSPSSRSALLLGIANGILGFLLALFVTFFFYASGERLARRSAVPFFSASPGPRADRLIDRDRRDHARVVYGILGTAVVQGILTVVRPVDVRRAAPAAARAHRRRPVGAADRRAGGVDSGRASGCVDERAHGAGASSCSSTGSSRSAAQTTSSARSSSRAARSCRSC